MVLAMQHRTNTRPARARRAGRYVLEQRLGVGATASVWRARDRRSGNDVCVKQLHEHLAADGDARRQLQTEADSVARLRHPSVLPLLDVRLDEAPPSLVFAHAPGESITSIAELYDVDPTDLADLNGIENWDLIFVGQHLLIPGLAEPSPSPEP
jgi:serine/threonine protein kinase